MGKTVSGEGTGLDPPPQALSTPKKNKNAYRHNFDAFFKI